MLHTCERPAHDAVTPLKVLQTLLIHHSLLLHLDHIDGLQQLLVLHQSRFQARRLPGSEERQAALLVR